MLSVARNRTAQKNPHSKNQLLRNHFLLTQLAENDLHQISKAASIEHYGRNQSIFFQGDRKTDLMIVVSGRVKLSATSADGRELLASILEPGDMLGEISVIDGRPRSYDATALAPTELLIVHRQDLIPFLAKRPEICVSWLAILCERLRHSEKLVQETVFLKVEARLARQLIGLAKAYGRKQGKGIFLDVKLTQRDLANLVGMTRESINKQLCRWRRQGVVAFRGKQYTILDFDFLKREVKKA